MKVSRAYINAFVKQLEALDAQAGRTIVNQAAKLDLEKRLLDGDELAYEEVARLMRLVVPSSARLASAMTCQYYDGIRQGFNVPGEFKAETYETQSLKEINAMAWQIADDVAHGRNTKPLSDLLSGSNTKYTRRASNETVRRNAKKDPAKPKYAIVPGAGACVFCMMRASAGYELPDAASVESHAHCTCQAVQVYKDGTVQGFDPQKYLDGYYNAKGAYESGNIPDDLNARIDRTRELHNEKYARGELKDPWGERNATLMVWRWQLGETDA